MAEDTVGSGVLAPTETTESSGTYESGGIGSNIFESYEQGTIAANIFGDTPADPPPVPLRAKEAVSTPSDSVAKVKKPKRAVRKAAAKPKRNKIVEKRKAKPSQGYGITPVKWHPGHPADFYRHGKQIVHTDETGKEVVTYEHWPRFIEEFDGEERHNDNAHIHIIGRKKGGKIEMDLVPKYTKFLLTGVQESHQERSQIVETFGDFYVFFYGERPPVYTFSGTLVNSRDINWLADFMFYYENFLRGTKAVENEARAIVTYQGRQVEGFITQTSNVTSADSQNGVQFNFSIIVTLRRSLRAKAAGAGVGPIGASVDFGLIEVDKVFRTSNTLTQLFREKGLSRAEVSKAWTDAQFILDQKKAAQEARDAKAAELKALAKEYNTNIRADNFGDLVLPA